MRRLPLRAMCFALFIAAINFFNFSRLSSRECIRAIHIVTLLTSGAAIGVFLSNLFMLIKGRQVTKAS